MNPRPVAFQEFLHRASSVHLAAGDAAEDCSSDSDDSDAGSGLGAAANDADEVPKDFGAFVRRASFLHQQSTKASSGVRDDRLGAVSEIERYERARHGASGDGTSSDSSDSDDEGDRRRRRTALLQGMLSPQDANAVVDRYLDAFQHGPSGGGAVGATRRQAQSRHAMFGRPTRGGSGGGNGSGSGSGVRPKGPYSSSDSSSSSEDEKVHEYDDEGEDETDEIEAGIANTEAPVAACDATKTENMRR